MSDYSELKKLAEAATPGQWDRSDGNEVSVSYEGDEAYWSWENAGPAQLHGSGAQPIADADFIAAANPAAVLALIAENEHLKAGGQLLVGDRNELRVDRDQLKTENEALRKALKAAEVAMWKADSNMDNEALDIRDLLADMSKGEQS
ncbi:ead/Ea22-like family protein [Pseudomonas sp. GL-RE-29]|uniref:ead/Ea22-like family protein n=1 Tax=Pseudomonas sp. GL-RE-29 TaxID=2832375 RepID=UPI001CBD2569|nr:ead/Ea22-like family protein [Pseudomonas sp. GL-RE-29]